jgi:hypothetical protein
MTENPTQALLSSLLSDQSKKILIKFNSEKDFWALKKRLQRLYASHKELIKEFDSEIEKKILKSKFYLESLTGEFSIGERDTRFKAKELNFQILSME